MKGRSWLSAEGEQGRTESLLVELSIEPASEVFRPTSGMLAYYGERCSASTLSVENMSGAMQREIVEQVLRDRTENTPALYDTVFHTLSPPIMSGPRNGEGGVGVPMSPAETFSQEGAYRFRRTTALHHLSRALGVDRPCDGAIRQRPHDV